MNKQLEASILNFTKSIEFLSNVDAASLAKKEVKRLLTKYKPTTVRAYLTIYRKLIKVDSALINNALSLRADAQNGIQRAYVKKIAKQQKTLVKIKDINGMLSKAVDLLSSENVGELTAALCLLTGRRMTEILKTAKFTNSKNSKNIMLFEGQLKTESKKKYEIYVLGGKRDECKAALKKLREVVDSKSLSNLEVSRKYETTVNAKVIAWFSEHLGQCSAHDLRAVYATFCAENYKPKNQTTNSFLSKILGHGDTDINTANSYQKYFL